MSLVSVRSISSDELRDYRRGLKKGVRRYISTKRDPRRMAEAHDVDDVQGSTAYVSVPGRPGVKRDAREVRDALMDRRWGAMSRLAEKDPEWFTNFAQQVRKMNPDLVGHMTNEEIVKTVWERMHKEATEEAYRMAGRTGATI